MLINISDYFVGELHVPQVGEGSSSKINNNDEFQRFLDEYEVDIMDLALGKQTSNELFSNVHSQTGMIINGADPKWAKLIEGDTYESKGRQLFWQGIRNRTGSVSRSMIAYYVYYKYMTDNIIQKSTLGMVRGQAENSITASTIPTLTRAWRKLYKWYGDCNYNYSHGSHYRYRGLSVSDYFGDNNTNEVSLYRYMSDHRDEFPNWSFTPIENKNQFQI